MLSKTLSAYKGRSVLITGGLGFIGSNLARNLVEMGDVEVIVLDALMPDQGGNSYNIQDVKAHVNLHEGDMGDDCVPIIWSAAWTTSSTSRATSAISIRCSHPHRDLELNCTAQLTLLEACRNFNPHVKIVFTSTRQVYGKPLYLPLDEEHRVAPLDVNGINKLAAEHYHLLYNRVYGTRTVCLRLTNTYGPRQLLRHNRQGFIGWFVRQAIEGGVIELYGEGRQRRDMNYVDDVVEALLLAGASETAEGEVLNLGGEEATSLADLAQELVSLTGRGTVRCVPFPAERQLIDIGNSFSSYRKIEAALGWSPRTPLREGLARTIEFYEQHRAHYWSRDVDALAIPRMPT